MEREEPPPRRRQSHGAAGAGARDEAPARQDVLREARLPLVVSHAPGHMLVTDLTIGEMMA
jgi:hypothetical protein